MNYLNRWGLAGQEDEMLIDLLVPAAAGYSMLLPQGRSICLSPCWPPRLTCQPSKIRSDVNQKISARRSFIYYYFIKIVPTTFYNLELDNIEKLISNLYQ